MEAHHEQINRLFAKIESLETALRGQKLLIERLRDLDIRSHGRIEILKTYLQEATGLVRKYAPLVDVSRFEKALGKERS